MQPDYLTALPVVLKPCTVPVQFLAILLHSHNGVMHVTCYKWYFVIIIS